MIQNKRGLSTIVVTLIIIVLSLVAVGVVWVVVNNLLKTGTANANINAQCLGVNLQITQTNCSAPTAAAALNKNCSVQISRTGTSTEPLAGIKLVFRNSTASAISPGVSYSSIPVDVLGDVPSLVGIRTTVDTLVVKANGLDTVEINPYFKDTSGNVQLCSQTSSFSFIG